MNQLVKQIQTYIDSEGLFNPEERLLVAVSAGVDSMTMVQILSTLGYKMGLAHVNFKLRGVQSDLDEILVRETAKRMDLPVYITGLDAQTHACEMGISIQMSARELRYQWFQEISASKDYQVVVTAHHLNDVLETVLMNLTKGAGIAGLHGILPKKKTLVRPLLSVTKQQITVYAINAGINWREDQSNLSEYYQRNLIRNQVVPILKKINPNIEISIKQSTEILRAIENQYNRTLDQLKQQYFIREGENIRISKSNLCKLDAPVTADLIRAFGFSYSQSLALLKDAINHTGKVFYSASHILNVDREEVIISPIRQPASSEVLIYDHQELVTVAEANWQLTRCDRDAYHIVPHSNVGAFDLDKLVFPLKARKWEPGDRFQPLGLKHQKKISDYLVDAKIPLSYKDGIMVLVSAEEIIWVVGHRVDDRYKVRDSTSQVLEIKIGAGK